MAAGFQLPQRLEHLTQPEAPWSVKKFEVNSSKLLSAIEDAAGQTADDSCAVTKHSVFDPVCSVLLGFESASADLKQMAFEISMAAVKGATRACKNAVGSMASDCEVESHRTALVMALCLLCNLVIEAEKLQAKSTLTSCVAAKPKKGAKKAVSKLHDSCWNWGEHREPATLQILQALELDLQVLWNHRVPDDAFLMLPSRAAYAMMEQPSVMKGASDAFKEALWRLVAIPAVRHEQAVSTVGSLVHLLLNFEHLPLHLVDLAHHVLEEHECPRLVVSLLQEVAELAPGEMGADAAGPKNVAAFLSGLAGKAPLMLLANYELLLAVLSSDAYTLRCGAVSALGQLLAQASRMLSCPPEVKGVVDGLLETALERLHDTSSFVRYRVLTTLCMLCEARAVPAGQFVDAVEQGLGRLHDKNANVRRGALQLYGRALEFNPFCPTFDKQVLNAKRAQLAAAVEEVEQTAACAQASTPPKKGSASPTDGATTPEKGGGGEEGGGTIQTADEAAGGGAAAQQKAALKLVDSALRLESVLSESLGIVSALLGSQTNSDVLEAMGAIVAADAFAIVNARPSAFLTLVWSREPSVRAAALECAQAVWLRGNGGANGGGSGGARHVAAVARGLLSLVRTANLAELTSLEEVCAEWQRQEALPNALFALLWEVVEGRRAEMRDVVDRRAALALLTMAASADAGIVRCKMDVVLGQLRGKSVDLEVARHACVAMQICAGKCALAPKVGRSLLVSLEQVLMYSGSAESAAWYATAEQAINTAFAVHAAPERWATALLRRMAAAAFKRAQPTAAREAYVDGGRMAVDVEGGAGDESVESRDGGCEEVGAGIEAGADAGAAAAVDGGVTVKSTSLARFVFCLGHVAIKMLAHIESCEKELTRQRNKLLDMQEEGGGATPAKKGAKNGDRRRSVADEKADEEDLLAQELGTSAAEAEANSERLLALGEQMLAPTELIGSWTHLVVAICRNANGAFNAELRTAATLSLCKLMCCSAPFCESQLQLLFTIIARETEVAVRANAAVALGDLVVRHPNLLEPWTSHLYRQLRDLEPRVRKSALMVLTHLILNDMVKVKGQVSEMALCLRDADGRISALARLFFAEFAKKGSAPVYNLLPDIVSTLSADESVDAEAFREIVGFLISFISKERQTEVMVEKLCSRFGATDDVGRQRDVAFCLGALGHTERSVRKLHELFKTYANLLTDAEIYSCFSGIVQKARKFARPELKAALEEYEAQLESKHAAANDADAAIADGEVPAEAVSKPAKAAPKQAKTNKGGVKAAKPKRRAKAKQVSDSSESETYDDDDDDDFELPAAGIDENQQPQSTALVQPAPLKATSRRGRAAREVGV